MTDNKKEDFDINLDEMGLNDSKMDNIDELLSDNTDEKQTKTEEIIDFNDFSIDDLDKALSQYAESRSSKKTPKAPVQTISALKKDSQVEMSDVYEVKQESKDEAHLQEKQEEVDMDVLLQKDEDVDEKVTKETDLDEKLVDKRKVKLNDVLSESKKKGFMNRVDKKSVDDNLENSNVDYLLTEDNEQRLRNLVWYDGDINEKVYEVSLSNMPEFLDFEKDVHTIHVNIDSSYGWNVFFENGVFMNLMDLKEYQERNGKLPGRNGKIIYGSKTTAFERIERIVVYMKPRYFAYSVEK